MEYKEFIESKKFKIENYGFKIELENINNKLFNFQKDIVRWAIKKGRCAVFLDTGLGKTLIQLEFARLINKNTLIIAPLSVARQTVREAKKINVNIKYVRNQNEIDYNECKINITNYELIDHFDFSKVENLILDESSILKSLNGAIKKKLFKIANNVPFRMACTATPAPNDTIEMGNHSEFLGICTMNEMLAMFFVNANKQEEKLIGDIIVRRKLSNKQGTEWRLKNHAREAFYKWLSSWAISMKTPSDLGYSDEGYILSKLNINTEFIPVKFRHDGELFFSKLKGITDRLDVRKKFIKQRLSKIIEILNTDKKGQWIIWSYLQDESTELCNLLKDNFDIKEVKGTDSPEYKANSIEDFQDGKFRILITKPKIAGFGMNFQNANNMIFFGMNDSWELYYQAIRREWRFGQTKEVNVFVVLTDVEQTIWKNIQRKDKNANILTTELINVIKEYEKDELMLKETEEIKKIKTREVIGDNYKLINGDSCQEMQKIESESIDLSIYSPPFADLFTYSNSEFDLGNVKNNDEFFKHFAYIIKENFRITKPGRLACVHVSDIPALQQKDGYIGVKDFPGDVINAYTKAGWIFHGRIFIQKNPQAQAIRTHSKALLFVQIRKDSCHSRPALVDQILLFKKDGENKKPVNPVDNRELDNEKWIAWAHGIWTGIQETNTLRVGNGRHADDEKHICPLQLETIERCIKLYSNPGETVFTPFMGIGSEVYQALKYGRKGVGIELKDSYFDLAVTNIKKVNEIKNQNTLFEKGM